MRCAWRRSKSGSEGETVMGATADDATLAAAATVRALLVELAGHLALSSAVVEPEAEARELLAALLDQPRWWLALNLDTGVEPPVRESALAAARKRAKGAP